MTSRVIQPIDDVTRAAQWLAERKGDEFGTVIPTIKQRFGLTSLQAAQACTLAQQFRNLRRAHA